MSSERGRVKQNSVSGSCIIVGIATKRLLMFRWLERLTDRKSSQTLYAHIISAIRLKNPPIIQTGALRSISQKALFIHGLMNFLITSSEDLNQSLLEWGNSTGFTNVTMANVSGMTNWYKNMTGLADGMYNYTVWAENATGKWNWTGMRFVSVKSLYIDLSNKLIE